MTSSETEQPIVNVSAELTWLAWALVLAGVIVAFFILNELFNTYLVHDGNSFINGLTDRFSNTTLITIGEFPVYVTEHGALMLAYFVFIPIALLGVHIAIALIRAGSHILSPIFSHKIARLKSRIDHLSEKFDKT